MRIAEGRVVVTAHESAGGIHRIVRIVGDNRAGQGRKGLYRCMVLSQRGYMVGPSAFGILVPEAKGGCLCRA